MPSATTMALTNTMATLTTGHVQDTNSTIDAIDDDLDAEIGDEEVTEAIRSEGDVWALHRRTQDSVFDAWFIEQVQTTDIQHVPKARRTEAEPNESLKDMLKKQQEGSPIIGSERAYQIELFERAKQQNTIAVLDTGTGKTLIAILLLKYVLDQEIEAQASGKPRKIAVFLVEKVTLMLQQEAVLRANLSHKVIGLRGDSDYKLWEDDQWQKIISENDCIVCTADVMLFSLMRSFVKLRDVALLIFDEAHHAKGNHPYARIMKRYYPRDQSRQKIAPRVFGMTASPIDVEDHVDVEEKALELEATLHATITTTTGSELDKFISRPVESHAVFQASCAVLETRLFQALKARYWDLPYFNVLFQNAQRIATDMGPWCSDKYWTFAFSEQAAKKLMQKTGYMSQSSKKETGQEPNHEPENDAGADEAVQIVADEVAELQNAAVDIQDYKLEDPEPDFKHLSPKVMRLRELLLEYFERPTTARCLVFVEERATARLLKEVFDHIGTSHMMCGYLVGSTAKNVENVKHSFTEQIKTLIRFRKGEINCLFATSVAEEGLDVPDCNLIVRYDPCKTMIQYIQSRGRARHRSSRYIHLVDGSSYSSDLINLEDIKDCEDRMRRYCRALPEDRRVLGTDPTSEDLEARDDQYPSFRNPKTGATLSYFFSLVVVHHFVDCIPRDETDDMAVTYTIFNEGRKFRCELTLPERARVPSVQGRSYGRKMEAKMSAAYETCRMLYKKELLDDFFLPTIRQELHSMRGAKLALKNKMTNGYEMQTKPAAWAIDRGSIPEKVYCAKLELDGKWDHPTCPLILLTRSPLPQLPVFQIFRICGTPVNVRVESAEEPLVLTKDTLSKLNWFSLTVFKDIYNKQFEDNPANMSYWLAPTKGDFTGHVSTIDWDLLDEIHEQLPIEWDPSIPADSMVGKFFTDPFHGGKRYFTEAVAHGTKAADPMPELLKPGKPNAKTVLDYSCSLFAKSKERQVWNYEQPVLRAKRVLHRLDVLASPSESDKNAALDCLIVPQPIRMSRLPTAVVSMALLFPAIIHRIESYMIALEFTSSRGLTIEPALALEALTKDSDNSDEHAEVKINIQHGMGPNYERLEFLGDAFLKMATSIAIYMRNPGKDEHWMHADRMALLCNKTLMDNAIAREVPKYIRSQSFSRRLWYPEGLKLQAGKGANKDHSQGTRVQLSGKSIADVCEATMGAALVNYMETGYEDPSCMDNAVRAVTEFVANRNLQKHDMRSWADYYQAYNVPKWQLEPCGAIDQRLAREIENAHCYRFRHGTLLVSAFTHPSLPNSYRSVPSYQRLEFLGDSLLDVAIDWYLFKKYPDADPSWLTEHKMPMVSNKFMGALSAKLGFPRHMKHQSSTLMNQMTAYLAEYEEGAAQAQGRPDFWLELRDPPKYMADLVEAYVGAMFVDSHFHYPEVQRFFDIHILPFFHDMSIYDAFANNHPVNRLRERLEVQLGCRNHRLMVRERESDDQQSSVALSALVVHKKCIGRGQASSTKVAKFHAAAEAASVLEGLTPRAFRMQFGCDCVAVEDEVDGIADGVQEVVI